MASKKPKTTKAQAVTLEQFKAYSEMFEHFNRELFSSKLKHPMLNFSRMANTYGFYAAGRWGKGKSEADEISINPAHLSSRPLKETASTLVHEMAHMWQQHFGDPPARNYHDKEWCLKMIEIGLIPISSKTREPKLSGVSMTHKIQKGGPFCKAFEAMPKAIHLPWTCSDRGKPAEPPKSKPNDDGDVEIGKPGPSAVEPKRNKTKYTCPGCQCNVWGKPGLAINCNKCVETFEEA